MMQSIETYQCLHKQISFYSKKPEGGYFADILQKAEHFEQLLKKKKKGFNLAHSYIYIS